MSFRKVPSASGSVGSRVSANSRVSAGSRSSVATRQKYVSQKLTITARLVVDRERISKLEEWIEHKLVTREARVVDDNVLYAASRDGFSNELFHQQCDGKSPTVVFVILADKRTFGGYTAIPWTSDNKPMRDEKAFLFSLSDGHERGACRLPLVQNKGYAVSHYQDSGPLFGVGAGSDLGLNLDEDKLHLCRSSVGLTYAIPQVSAREPVISDSYLAGKLNNWEIEDVVVYHCYERFLNEGSNEATPQASVQNTPLLPHGTPMGSFSLTTGTAAQGMASGVVPSPLLGSVRSTVPPQVGSVRVGTPLREMGSMIGSARDSDDDD